jgi:hypothetical protein
MSANLSAFPAYTGITGWRARLNVFVNALHPYEIAQAI